MNAFASCESDLIRDDLLNRFYTRESVGGLLVDQLGEVPPSYVIDLGAGQGSLSASIAKRWPSATFVTVDVDPSSGENLHENLLEAGTKFHEHHIADVFNWSALSLSLDDKNDFDLAICNPPFFRPKWEREFARILQGANLSDACSSTAEVSAELLFLAQNIRLLRDGGKLGFIAPDGMITGAKTIQLRRALLSQHSVECVVQLPAHSFHDTEARCFLLVLTKNGQRNEKIKLLRYDAKSGLSAPLFIKNEDGDQRLDFDYHIANQNSNSSIVTLRSLGADIKRGALTTVEARAANFPVFHTSDYGISPTEEVTISPTENPIFDKRLITARPGDILIARVDRRLHEKVAILVEGEAAPTDCVYRVRLPEDKQRAVFQALRSPEGIARLQAASKGVSARLLSKADLLDIPLEIRA